MGGINLYGFVRNNGVNRVDYLGLTEDYAIDCDCGNLTITRLPSKMGGMLMSIQNALQGYNVEQDLTSGGHINDIVTAPRYSLKVTDSNCDNLEIRIGISAQFSDQEYFDQTPMGSRPNTGHIGSHNQDISNNQNIFIDDNFDPDENLMETSYNYDYTVINQQALANGIYQIDQKQLYVKATVIGRNSDSKFRCGCQKTYWIKARRPQGAVGLDIGSIVNYNSGQVHNPPPIEPPTF
jgi:hypothetical protein